MHSDELQTSLEGYNTADSDYLNLRYLGVPQIAVRGTITRNLYSFSANWPVRAVDERDAKCMLASGLFGIAS